MPSEKPNTIFFGNTTTFRTLTAQILVLEPRGKLGYLNSNLMLRWDGHFNDINCQFFFNCFLFNFQVLKISLEKLTFKLVTWINDNLWLDRMIRHHQPQLNPPPPGGGGGVGSDPLDFFGITSSLTVSTWNLAYLAGHLIWRRLTQKIKIGRKFLAIVRIMWCHFTRLWADKR